MSRVIDVEGGKADCEIAALQPQNRMVADAFIVQQQINLAS